MDADFDLDGVNAAIAGTRFSRKIRHLASINSTNTLALEAAQSGADGVYVADEQTAGRGRGGHDWHSAAGDGLYVSSVVRPQMNTGHALWLSLSTGLAAQTAIARTTGLFADLRWPNDLIINGRKCGGVLVETSAIAGHQEQGSRLRYAVIGVGINVNHTVFPEGLNSVATSLRMETGCEVKRELLLSEFLLALEDEVGRLDAEACGEKCGAGVLERFTAASGWVQGKRVKVEESGGYTGLTDGLDEAGFLRVLLEDGSLRIVLSGGVRPQD